MRDGIAPDELLKIGREQLQPCTTVRCQAQAITAILPQFAHFLVTLQDHIVCIGGIQLPRRALFTAPTAIQHSDLAIQVGCALTEAGLVSVDAQTHTNVPGIYAAGDMTTLMRFVAGAVMQGAIVGVSINTDLIAEDFQ